MKTKSLILALAGALFLTACDNTSPASNPVTSGDPASSSEVPASASASLTDEEISAKALEDLIAKLGNKKQKINVAIGNAHEIRGMRGRKTDRNDADWLARVAKHGSFHPSYVPGREYRGLRSLARYATSLRGTLSSEKNRLGKLFNAAGYRLNSVFSDMFGTAGMI